MTATLTDDELDDLLAGARRRLRAATADVTLGAAPSASFPASTVLRIAAAVAVVGGATAGIVAVNRSGDGRDVPTAFPRGDFGTEVVLQRVDDGDSDPNTERLTVEPGGQSLRVLSGAAAARFAGDPSMARCWELGGGTAICGPERTAELSISRSRGQDSLAVVLWIPDDIVAVAFDAGAVRSWARPVDGTAAFPFPLDASGAVTATLVRADGTAVEVLEGSDPTPTEAERTTRPDDRTLPPAPVIDAPPTDFAPPVTYVRRRGRSGGTMGFDGPFLMQTFERIPGGVDNTIGVVTVRAEEADSARARLVAAHAGGSVVTEVPGDGVVTLVWAGSAVPADAGLAAVDSLRVGEVPANAFDLDRTYSWTGPSDTTMYRFANTRVVEAMLFDDVGVVGVDGQTFTVRAGGDDAGTVQFWLAAPDGQWSGSTSVASGSGGRLPPVGELAHGLWAVPASTTSLSITLDDGRVITPELVDIRPTANAKLAVMPASVTDHRIASVSST